MYVRPVLTTKTDTGNLDTLIDTGAIMPVWTRGDLLLKDYFPDAERCENFLYHLGGFGGSGSETPVFRIPDFVISDDERNETALHFHNLHLACVHEDRIKFPLILSASMFGHIDYEFLNIGEEAPRCVFNSKKDTFEIGTKVKATIYDQPSGRMQIMSIYSFDQE